MPSLQKNIVHKCTYAQSTAVISKYGFIPANKKDTAKEKYKEGESNPRPQPC